MILYHAITTYQLISVILYKNKYYKKEKSVLLLSESIVFKYPEYQKFLRYFDDIILIKITFRIYQSFKKDTKEYYENILKENNLSISDFNEIFVGGAQMNFGIYLTENKISFHYLEEAPGALSRADHLKGIDFKLDPARGQVSLRNGLYTGENEVIKTVIINKYVQLPGFDVDKKIAVHIESDINKEDYEHDDVISKDEEYDENQINFFENEDSGQSDLVLLKDYYEHFDPVEELFNISDEERTELLELFEVNIKIDIPENSLLLLTLHFANLKMMTFEEQVLLYQLFADYFCEDYNLVFKPHPDDIMYYDILFPEAQIIKEVFPSEFLPFILKKEPEVFATIASTSIFSLKNIYNKKILEFTPDYEKDFIFTHRYYIALKFINQLCNNHTVYSLGTNNEILANFLSYGEFKNDGLNITYLSDIYIDENDNTNIENVFSQIKDNSVLIIDNILKNSNVDFLECVDNIVDYMKYIDNQSVIIFLNSAQDFCFYDIFAKELWEHIIPIVVNKKAMRDDEFYSDTETEIIYLYTKNEEYKEMAKNIKIDKKLKYTGLEVAVNPYETAEQLKIKVLEGILAATEKRLLYYINKEKENNKNK